MYCYFILSFLITIIHFDLDYKIPGHRIDFAGYFLMSERGVWFPCLGICLRCFQIPLLSLWSEGDSCVYRTPPPPPPAVLGLESVSRSVMWTLCNSMDCSPPGSSVHGILQARILEWVAISSSRGSSQPKDWTQVSCITSRFFTWKALTIGLAKNYLGSSVRCYGKIHLSFLANPILVTWWPIKCF